MSSAGCTAYNFWWLFFLWKLFSAPTCCNSLYLHSLVFRQRQRSTHGALWRFCLRSSLAHLVYEQQILTLSDYLTSDVFSLLLSETALLWLGPPSIKRASIIIANIFVFLPLRITILYSLWSDLWKEILQGAFSGRSISPVPINRWLRVQDQFYTYILVLYL